MKCTFKNIKRQLKKFIKKFSILDNHTKLLLMLYGMRIIIYITATYEILVDLNESTDKALKAALPYSRRNTSGSRAFYAVLSLITFYLTQFLKRYRGMLKTFSASLICAGISLYMYYIYGGDLITVFSFLTLLADNE